MPQIPVHFPQDEHASVIARVEALAKTKNTKYTGWSRSRICRELIVDRLDQVERNLKRRGRSTGD